MPPSHTFVLGDDVRHHHRDGRTVSDVNLLPAADDLTPPRTRRQGRLRAVVMTTLVLLAVTDLLVFPRH
ncbi:hypothetical protein Sipo8835_21260 [Streptomyces ipomoeae]|uniref:Uncharacterized protein n=1 Tax=Streptomyces ipomoeae TaxID=103232 RepID=A0AAE8W0Q0_9ACTN|nr:hypothetical protein [Streptomyces ipomoeae]MDX2697853.1 hypothetical protein [Streptomyces ipomoeae]MDX2843682.1 hypothetical protein [Streptomyces ipomoeae]TQE32149.1 hypothetical protein Sipo8835_21260 [Streptomyces ipomoeae]TQE37054.1 hypothetical protein Sipo7851_10195 [Streptomyces ipomoeae]